MDRPRTRYARLTWLAALTALAVGCGGGGGGGEMATETETETDAESEAPAAAAAETGFGEMPIPADNPQTPEKIALGHQLYFDRRSRSTARAHVTHVTYARTA